MIFFLRIVGTTNAAIWFGGNVVITFVAFTGFFSPEMKRLLSHEYYPGAVAQIVFQHFFMLQYCCGALALVHYFTEAICLGRAVFRARLWLLIGTLALVAFGGFIAQPKLKELHETKYLGASAQVKQNAASQLRQWHSATQLANLLVIVGVGIYFWSTVSAVDSPRFSRVTKFKG